jgi:hypothetical protein
LAKRTFAYGITADPDREKDMTNAKGEGGKYIPMTFPKRMMLYVVIDLLLINLITYYWKYGVFVGIRDSCKPH